MPTTGRRPIRSVSQPNTGAKANIPAMCALRTSPTSRSVCAASCPALRMCTGVMVITPTITTCPAAMAATPSRAEGRDRTTGNAAPTPPPAASGASTMARATTAGSGLSSRSSLSNRSGFSSRSDLHRRGGFRRGRLSGLGRHLTRHRLGTGTVMGVTFISYAFNLNLGSLVGGVAFRYRVPASKTVPRIYEEAADFQLMPAVLATGYLVALVEWACVELIKPHLDWPGEQSLGTHVDLSHTAATPPGLTIEVRVRLAAVDGRKLVFEVSAHDGFDKITEGRHERHVIDAARFAAKVAAKSSGARVAA